MEGGGVAVGTVVGEPGATVFVAGAVPEGAAVVGVVVAVRVAAVVEVPSGVCAALPAATRKLPTTARAQMPARRVLCIGRAYNLGHRAFRTRTTSTQ